MSAIEVRQNTDDDRFESEVPGGLAYIDYIMDGDEITFSHTEVPKEAEGKGIAGQLVSAAMAFAREANLRVIPQCSYVAAWLKRYREYDDIVHPEYRER